MAHELHSHSPQSQSLGSYTDEFSLEVDSQIPLESRPERQPTPQRVSKHRTASLQTQSVAVAATPTVVPDETMLTPRKTQTPGDTTTSTAGFHKKVAKPIVKPKLTGIRRALALARIARRRKVRRQSGLPKRSSPVKRGHTKQDHPKVFNHGASMYFFCGPRARKMNHLVEAHASDQCQVSDENASLAMLKQQRRISGKVSVVIADADSSGKGPDVWSTLLVYAFLVSLFSYMNSK